jgi:hypothetical protein
VLGLRRRKSNGVYRPRRVAASQGKDGEIEMNNTRITATKVARFNIQIMDC